MLFKLGRLFIVWFEPGKAVNWLQGFLIAMVHGIIMKLWDTGRRILDKLGTRSSSPGTQDLDDQNSESGSKQDSSTEEKS